jgi:SAM-dependent methyltransferase
MPIPIDGARARDLAPRLDEALELVRNEFEGLDPGRQYRNAFARLLKPDPLGRVLMMGTDQRDILVPALRQAIETCVPSDGHIFDFGAGDGQTFALVASSVPAGTRVSIEEPNAGYVADYSAFLGTQTHLRRGITVVSGFEAIDADAERSGIVLPDDGSIDLALALHMIYFLDDLPGGLTRMMRFVRQDGTLFVVFADEAESYTGTILRRFIDRGGDIGDHAGHLSAIDERRRLLASPAAGGGAITEVLSAGDMQVDLEARCQPTRLYGHTLADIIALATITALSAVESMSKFEVATDVLRHEPELVDLRIEDAGPRRGMWSVTQPQWISIVRKLRSA